jgi:hypothetical protein
MGFRLAWSGPNLPRRPLSTAASISPLGLPAQLALDAPAKVAERTRLQKLAEDQEKAEPPIGKMLVVTEAGPTPDATYITDRGVAANKKEQVEPGFLQCMGGGIPEKIVPTASSSGRRTALAAWIASEKNPLTARVLVNRLWQGHFSVGLVKTPNDFGLQGARPTHPELLDWLAADFVKSGWSLKALHKKILLSATYRQSSVAGDSSAAQKDPNNALLHRYNVRRLEGEAIRDALLACSGRLDKKQGGPSVFLHLTEFVEGRGRPPQGPLDGDGRRSLYLAVRRNFLSPWLQAFDFPTPFTCIGKRSTSNVPAQALALLNGPLVKQQAALWGEKLLAVPAVKRLEVMYETAFGRPPTAQEKRVAQDYVAGRESEKAAWADLAHVIFNVKEFVFVR